MKHAEKKSMKLVTSKQSELMEVTAVRVEGDCIIIDGTIMGAMPIQAVVTGTELRKGYSMLSAGTISKIVKIFFAGKGA